jgi:hypothetical protein
MFKSVQGFVLLASASLAISQRYAASPIEAMMSAMSRWPTILLKPEFSAATISIPECLRYKLRRINGINPI